MRLSSFLLFCSSSLFLLCLSLSLLTDEWSFLPCNPNASQTPRETRVSHLVMIWYGPLLFVHFSVCFHSFPVLCTYTFCDVLPLAYSSFFLFLFSFLQVEIPPPTTSGTLVKEVMTAPSVVPLGVENEPPSGDVTEEVRQLVKDVQPILPFIPLVAQDSEASQSLVPQDPQPVQTLSPTKTVSHEPTTKPALR